MGSLQELALADFRRSIPGMKQDSCNKTLILGAGISGLLAAEVLRESDGTIQIVDKGRSPGGRMATRRHSKGRVDHGAQFFTAREEAFKNHVTHWIQAGCAKEWFRRSPVDSDPQGYPRYAGIRGISDIPKELAKRHDVFLGVRIKEMDYSDHCWTLRSEVGETFSGSWLLMTAPLPQTLDLMDQNAIPLRPEFEGDLRNVQFERALAIIVELEGPSGIPNPGHLPILDNNVLAWAADNQKKGISPDHTLITLHTTSDFAEKYWDAPDAERIPIALRAAASFLGANVRNAVCHRWKFTRPINPLQERYYLDKGRRLAIAGDAFGGPRVEGSALSGLAVGDALNNAIAESTDS